MKILAIRGKNLASLEEAFELDFTVEPLLSAGIFTITGQTGSGKSTILDALCLSLFDETPRMNHAGENNIPVPDVRDKTINQKDCRTILRRGTAEGYAEVDFISLGGEKFRSTWSVKRARGKTDGTLQNTEIRLLNLSSGEEVPGRKTELLYKIGELIGLTFDQFTRAVLLAQGDFATFLKAKQSEKAELLEKLTGTDIYSRISARIYEKTRSAEQDYQVLQKQIQDIELLTDEQIETYHSEKNRIENTVVHMKKALHLLTAKIKWIEEQELLSKSLAETEKSLTEIRNAIAGAKSRYDYIDQLESVQEIRDTFNEFQHSTKQLENNRNILKQKTVEYESIAQNLMEAAHIQSILEKEQEDLEQEINDIEPIIIQARMLDVRIDGAKTNAEEAEKEYKTAQTATERIEKNTQIICKEIETARTERNRLIGWFEEHRVYQQIISQKDLIINLLNDSQTAKEQSIRNRKIKEDNENFWKTEVRRLTELNSKLEQLNRILPTEIATLRAKLQEGLPCPVCGSLHHPAQNVTGEQNLHEEELNKAKQQALNEISRLTENIDKRKVEITRLTALIENYAGQSAVAMEKASAYLADLPVWKEFFEKNDLQSHLKQIAEQWTQNIEAKNRMEATLDSKNSLLQNEQNNRKEALNNLESKEKKKTESAMILIHLQKERAGLLAGKSVDELSDYYADKKKEIASKLKMAVENKNTLSSKQELLKGIIIQIKNDATRIEMRLASLQQEIDLWITGRSDSMTEQRLAELLSKNNQWIATEKQFLEDLKNRETSAKATFEERNNNLLKHYQAEIKPSDEKETKVYLSEKQAENNFLIEQGIKQLAEIEVTLINHNKNKERIHTYKKELAEKATLAENWKKLNELFGSATGSKFKEIAQGYTLDVLLTYANKHLKGLSNRYELQRIPNTLALQVTDLDMLGDIRTVHSLSGGESFLISLALALGLSSLSSNRMKVESLFIDEGFGSLDADTLRVAMDALESLQMQGRKIGVISHVEEMTERIATQVCVIKTTNGKSSVKIVP
ncbi:MAG: AAA family ATPase [Dysgonamonadaceae bacterium]|jgi:exonuclease SbcC|nr:AAA family ATPase [Dysgonamonadaceae bacterium]